MTSPFICNVAWISALWTTCWVTASDILGPLPLLAADDHGLRRSVRHGHVAGRDDRRRVTLLNHRGACENRAGREGPAVDDSRVGPTTAAEVDFAPADPRPVRPLGDGRVASLGSPVNVPDRVDARVDQLHGVTRSHESVLA